MLQDGKFQTERLRIRNWANCLNESHRRQKLIDELGTVLTPAVLHHLPKPLQISDHPDAIDVWMTERAAESDVMTIRDRTNSDLLGLLILAEIPESNAVTAVHLGYMFAECAWGKGYATELLAGLIDWYKVKGQPVRLFAGVETDNVASSRVLQKNGFARVAELSGATTDMFSLVI